jgi:hypothetical protein
MGDQHRQRLENLIGACFGLVIPFVTGGPCSFSVKATTTSTSVVPSAVYVDFNAGAAGLSAGDFVVKVVKT